LDGIVLQRLHPAVVLARTRLGLATSPITAPDEDNGDDQADGDQTRVVTRLVKYAK